ncbi:MAG: amidophosphoribosyltransferase [Bacteroidetes bacterium]|nr:amidophosphoribosyltransferase [Bacteroidota bacterium]MBL0064872.1 amidophosphoribosyltransferase [Bacteroidota bacterium]MBL0137169.1 amidophosphoribosyltransferase [Bacteroidota bacterium]
MSDSIHHECGVALIRLLKPLSYYQEKYGTSFYALNKLYLLMEKQHNRGQDGAGIANIKFDVDPGTRYISRYRSNHKQAIADIYARIHSKFEQIGKSHPDKINNPEWLKKNVAFTGELWLGHLRYGTYGGNSIEACHPFLRQNNWMTRNLVVAGNFNMTNVDELFEDLVKLGQHPKEKADTVTVMENIGHFLDVENDELYYKFKELGNSKQEISPLIAGHLDIAKILRNSSQNWDGGYTIAGLFGHGDAFVLRDPAGIRPAFYYRDEEIVVVTSERPAIQTALNVPAEKIQEIKPGHALIIRKNGKITEEQIKEPTQKLSCSFERIYFSRGSDVDIYKERKELGRLLCQSTLQAVDHDLRNTVLSFIPNTAEVAFYGMLSGMEDYLRDVKKRKIKALGDDLTDEKLNEILSIRPRAEKIAIKDAKLRTFITNDTDRSDMVTHVYDITYGTIRKGIDNLVVIDDSIVRGTTLKNSILRMLDRLGPKKIVIVSSAPQIRYPDCYGIDMARIGDLVAFRAAIELLDEHNMEHIVDEVYQRCKEQLELGVNEMKNFVRMIYQPFTAEQISAKIAQLVRPDDCKAEVQIIFQKIEDLHSACPNHRGDWYFSGNYPTPGGNKVVSRAFINYIEGINARAY